MGICQFVVIIACRAAAKSFIIALYACCRCIVYPHSKIVLSSATKGQSKLIISEKIRNELMNMSPVLRKEILRIKDNQNEVIVYFRSGSTIVVVPASEMVEDIVQIVLFVKNLDRLKRILMTVFYLLSRQLDNHLI